MATFLKAKIIDTEKHLAQLKEEFDKNDNGDDEIIKIRDWFPVFHSGYFAIVGYKLHNNEFILTEPIISVYPSGEVFRSPHNFYELVGNLSISTYKMFDINYEKETVMYVENFTQKFFNKGLNQEWEQTIFKLFDLISISDARHLCSGCIEPNLNASYEEIQNPKSIHYHEKISQNEEKIFECMDVIHESIAHNKRWKPIFERILIENGYSSLIPDLNNIFRERIEFPSNCDLKQFKYLYLWSPKKKIGCTNKYYITGRMFKNGVLTEFKSEIRYVSGDGITILTNDGLVKLVGPICMFRYEKISKGQVFHQMMFNMISEFFGGFPHYWEKLVTVLELVLRIRSSNI